MKQIKLLAVLFALVPLMSNAADLFVNEFGTGGAYSTISAAITAASPNDRILIKARSGGAAYAENLTINKPLQLLSATDSTQWKMQGTVTFGNMATGEYYAIVGMYNLNGTVTAATGPAALPRAKLYMLDCTISAGNINVYGKGIEFTLANSEINNGTLYAKYIRAFGNYISAAVNGYTYPLVVISRDTITASPSGTEDTCYFVGNTIVFAASQAYYISADVFQWNNNSQYHCIMNNFVRLYQYYNNGVSSGYNAMTVIGKSGSGTNAIINNTIYVSAASPSYPGGLSSGIYYSPGTANNQVFNNILAGVLVYGINKAFSNNASISYNYSSASSSVLNNTPNDGTNSTISATLINSTTGVSSVVDNGYPSPVLYDTDLTINDAGCYGGSFTMNNYLPRHTGSTRVYFVDAPRSVVQGGQLNIKAEGYDR